MRYFNILTFLAALFVLNPCGNWAQEPGQLDPKLDYTGISFAPLQALLDSTLVHNPLIRFRDLDIIAKEANLKSYRSYWTRNFGLQTDVRYGTWDILSANTNEGQNPYFFASRSTQTNYGAGIYIKFPIYDLINRKNQVTMAKAELQQAESMAEAQRDEVKQLVIKLYNDLLLAQNLLKIKTKHLETTKINLEMVEKEFRNGVVPVTELTRISEIAGRAESEFESARTDFITAYMILEQIAGFRFIQTN